MSMKKACIGHLVVNGVREERCGASIAQMNKDLDTFVRSDLFKALKQGRPTNN